MSGAENHAKVDKLDLDFFGKHVGATPEDRVACKDPESFKQTYLETSIRWTLYFLITVAPLLYYPYLNDCSDLPKRAFIQVGIWSIFLIFLVKGYLNNQVHMSFHPAIISLAAWLIWSGMTVFWAVDAYSSFSLWFHWVSCSMIVVLILSTIDSLEKLDKLLIFAVVAGGMVSFVGIVQYIFDIKFIPHINTPSSTFLNKNIAVQFVVIIWPLALLFLFLSKTKVSICISSTICAVIFIFVLYTRTRAGWVCIAFLTTVCAVFSSWQWTRMKVYITFKKIAILVGFMALVYILSLVPGFTKMSSENFEKYKQSLICLIYPDLEKSGGVRTRTQLWANSLGMIKDNFPLGVGLGNWYVFYPLYNKYSIIDEDFGEKYQPKSPHNELIQIIAETSEFGLVFYLSIFFFITSSVLRTIKKPSDGGISIRAFFFFGAIVSFFLNSLFTFPLRTAVPPLSFMMVLSAILVLERISESCASYTIIPIRKYLLPHLIAVFFILFIVLAVFYAMLFKADGSFLESMVFLKMGRPKLALKKADDAKNYNPWKYKIWFNLALARNMMGLYTESADAYRKALEIHPYHLNSLINLCSTYLQMDEVGKAEKTIREALRVDGLFEKALLNMGVVQRRKGRYGESIKYFGSCLDKNSKSGLAYGGIGLTYLEMKKPFLAVKWLERAVDFGATFPFVQALESVYGDLRKASDRSGLLDQDAEKRRVAAIAYNYLGLQAWKEKNHKMAVTYFRKALEIDPNLGVAHVNLSALFLVTKQYELSRMHGCIAYKMGVPNAAMVWSSPVSESISQNLD